MLIAIGRKMIDLVSFSALGWSRSANTATARPKATVTAGTINIHNSVFSSVPVTKSLVPSRSV